MRYMRGELTPAVLSGGADAHRQDSGPRRWGALESELLAVLWISATPLTAAQLLVEVGDPHLAYNTVLTVLLRLHTRGVLTREKIGRAHAYRPTEDRTGQALRILSHALAHGDRVTLLQRFLDTLAPADQQALGVLLAQRAQPQEA